MAERAKNLASKVEDKNAEYSCTAQTLTHCSVLLHAGDHTRRLPLQFSARHDPRRRACENSWGKSHHFLDSRADGEYAVACIRQLRSDVPYAWERNVSRALPLSFSTAPAPSSLHHHLSSPSTSLTHHSLAMTCVKRDWIRGPANDMPAILGSAAHWAR